MNYPDDFLKAYQPILSLGSGGMGVVIRARQLGLGRDVVVKFLHEEVARDPSMRTRFVNEARICAGLRHPNIVPVLDVDAQARWIVFGFVQGKSAEDLLESRGQMPVGRVLDLAEAIADCLEFAHARGVVHRDLKPQNLLVGADDVVRVLDFGCATARAWLGKVTQEGVVLGTPAYMSPEQVRGEEAGPQADVYGLGATIFHLLTGRPPFAGREPTEILTQVLTKAPPAPIQFRPDVPASLDRLVVEALSKDPADRPDGMKAFRSRLAACRAGASAAPGARATVALSSSSAGARTPVSRSGSRATLASQARPASAQADTLVSRASPLRTLRWRTLALTASLAAIALLVWFLGRPGAAGLAGRPQGASSATGGQPPSGPGRASGTKPETDPVAELARSLRSPRPVERSQAAAALARVPGRRSLVVRCLALTGGEDPYSGERFEPEREAAVLDALVASLRITGDPRAVLPLLTLCDADRPGRVAEAAIAAVRGLSGVPKLMAPELVPIWASMERWQRTAFEHPYSGPRGTMAQGQNPPDELDVRAGQAGICQSQANDLLNANHLPEALALLCRAIWYRSGLTWVWRDYAYQLLFRQGRTLDCARVLWTARQASHSPWEWYGPEMAAAAHFSGLRSMATWSLRVTLPIGGSNSDSARSSLVRLVELGWDGSADDLLLAAASQQYVPYRGMEGLFAAFVGLAVMQGDSPAVRTLASKLSRPSPAWDWSDAARIAAAASRGDFSGAAALAGQVLDRCRRARVSEPAWAAVAVAMAGALPLREAREAWLKAAVEGDDVRDSLLWSAAFLRTLGYPEEALTAIDKVEALHPDLLVLPTQVLPKLRVQEQSNETLCRFRVTIHNQVGKLDEAAVAARRYAAMPIAERERYQPLWRLSRGASPEAAARVAASLETAFAGEAAAAKTTRAPAATLRAWENACLAGFHRAAGDRPRARARLAEAVRAAASQIYFEPCEFLLLEASLEDDEGHQDQARALRRLAAAAPDCPPTARLRLLAGEEQAAGRFEEAARHLRRAAMLDPLDWETLLSQARLDRAIGQPGRARELIERARALARLSLDPSAVPLVRALVRGHSPDLD